MAYNIEELRKKYGVKAPTTSTQQYDVEALRRKYVNKSAQKAAAPAKRGLVDRLLNGANGAPGIGQIFPGRKLGEALGTSFAAINQYARGNTKMGNNIIDNQVSVKEVAGDVANAVTLPGTFALNPAGSVAGRIAQGAGLGIVSGGATAMADNKSGVDIAKSAALGGAIGLGVGGALEGIKYAVKGVPKLLSYTSDTPEAVLKRNYDNPTAMKIATKELKAKGGAETLEHVRGVVRGLRNDLTTQFDEGVNVLADNNRGRAIGFTQGSKEAKLFEKIADDFAIDLPDDLANMSVKESIALNAELNELLRKPAIKITPQGVAVRKAKEILSRKISTFDGAKKFLSNYATEKEVFDAADSLVKAYNKNPVTASTAQSRLRLAFGENKAAYYSALKDLEAKTGVPILDKVAALATGQKLPKAGHSFLNQMVELLAVAVTSPRSAAAISRGAGRVGQSGANLGARAIITRGVQGASKKILGN